MSTSKPSEGGRPPNSASGSALLPPAPRSDLSHEMSRRIAVRLSLVLTASFVALLLLLHFIEPEFNLGHMISEYQLGDHGWLMSLAFFCLGASSLLLLSALNSTPFVHVGRIGRWGIMIIGIAYFGAGTFPPLPAPAIGGYLHGLSGLIVIFGSPIVFTSISRGVDRSNEGQVATRFIKCATAAVWIGLLLFVSSIAISPTMSTRSSLTLMSIFNRLMIGTYCVWLIVVAAHAARGWKVLPRT
jgi:hypothetical protein